MFGGPGLDTLDGGAARDTLEGGTNDDSLLGRSGNDILRGERGNDTLRGGARDDLLDGGAGDDRLFGGSGEDLLDGGTGRNTLDGGTGVDVFRLSGALEETETWIADFDFTFEGDVIDLQALGISESDLSWRTEIRGGGTVTVIEHAPAVSDAREIAVLPDDRTSDLGLDDFLL